MNWVLLLVLLILGYNIIRGYRKGFLLNCVFPGIVGHSTYICYRCNTIH